MRKSKVNTHSCSHQDGAASRPELMQSFLSVSLGAISVDAGAGVTLTVKEVLQSIRSFLGLDKHQSQRVFTCAARNYDDKTKGGEQDKEHERTIENWMRVCGKKQAY